MKKFDPDELNRLIELDLSEKRTKILLEEEIKDLEDKLNAKTQELDMLDRKGPQMSRAEKYFQEYLSDYSDSVVLA